MDAFGVASDPARNVPRNFQSELWPISLPIQFVATYDIGWFAARALEEPEKYAGRVIPLAGDS